MCSKQEILFPNEAHHGGCPFMNGQMSDSKSRPLWLKNTATGNLKFDTLHHKAVKSIRCQKDGCAASIMAGQTVPREGPRPHSEILEHAQDLMNEYYTSINALGSDEHIARIKAIEADITAKGTYELTVNELLFGAKLAWRNSARCIARMHWNKLELFDCRHITTTEQMMEALLRHVKFATNGGNIRVGITIFPQHVEGRQDFRLWNSQFIMYAGYEQPDGTVIGDPQHVSFTKVCQSLGWQGKGGRFDVLPLIVSAPGQPPRLQVIPEDMILEVPITHPQFKWMKDMGLKWYGLPAVADMRLDVGGIEFTAAPFNGWYSSPEIATRNFCDPHRYNILEDFAKRMGLDTSCNETLWKDKAMVHLNVAVLHSFNSAGISINDHHTAAEAYMKFFDQEQVQRGGCPSDWVWLLPPISASLMPTFYQEMLMYRLRPSYEYQDKAWKDFFAEAKDEKTEDCKKTT